MKAWMDAIDFLNKMGILPIIILLLAIPGGFLLTMIGAKRYLFSGLGSTFTTAYDTISKAGSTAFTVWVAEQKERTKIETKLEERLADLTEQLKQLVAAQWDNRRYIDVIMDEVKGEHKDILAKLDQVLQLIPKRRGDAEQAK